MISRQTFDVDSYLTDWMAAFPGGTFNGFNFPPGIYIPGFGPPLTYNVRNSAGALGGNLNFDAAKYLQQGACAGGACPLRAPEAIDGGWKDTIKMFPGEITRIAVRWAPQDIAANATTPGQDYFPFNPTNGPGLHRALPHPRPRGQRVHAAHAHRQVIVALRVLLLAVAAVALAAALAIGLRGRGDDHAAFATPARCTRRCAAELPGECPICRMALERVGKPAAARTGPQRPRARDLRRSRTSAGTTSSTSSAGARCWSLLRELRGPASVDPDGTMSAIFYDDQIEALDDGRDGDLCADGGAAAGVSGPPRAEAPASAGIGPPRASVSFHARPTTAPRGRAAGCRLGRAGAEPAPGAGRPRLGAPAIARGPVRARLDRRRLQLREATHRDRRDVPQAGFRRRAVRAAAERARGRARHVLSRRRAARGGPRRRDRLEQP